MLSNFAYFRREKSNLKAKSGCLIYIQANNLPGSNKALS